MRVIAIAAAVLLSASVRAENPWPDAYSRRNYQLGMTLNDFRTAEFPDQKEWPGAYPVCSGDERAKKYPYSSGIGSSAVWDDVGITKCVFFYDSDGRSTYRTGVMLAGVSATTDFYFIAEPKDAEPQLFQVLTKGPSESFEDLALTFEKAMGKPTGTVAKTLKNGMGAEFEDVTLTWENASSRVSLSKYGDSIREFDLEHILKPLDDVLSKRLDESREEKAKQL